MFMCTGNEELYYVHCHKSTITIPLYTDNRMGMPYVQCAGLLLAFSILRLLPTMMVQLFNFYIKCQHFSLQKPSSCKFITILRPILQIYQGNECQMFC